MFFAGHILKTLFLQIWSPSNVLRRVADVAHCWMCCGRLTVYVCLYSVLHTPRSRSNGAISGRLHNVYVICPPSFGKKPKTFDAYFKLVESPFHTVKDTLTVRNHAILYFVRYMYMVV